MTLTPTDLSQLGWPTRCGAYRHQQQSQQKASRFMKTLKKFDDSRVSSRNGSTHDWATLLNGKVYRLEKGDKDDETADYTCHTSTFIYLAKRQARKNGMDVKYYSVKEDEDGRAGVVIQAVPASAQLKKKWAKEDAEAAAPAGDEQE